MKPEQIATLLFTLARLGGEFASLVRQVKEVGGMDQAALDGLLKDLSETSNTLNLEAQKKLRGL